MWIGCGAGARCSGARVEDVVHGGAQSGGSRTFRARLPCRERAGAESCFTHWAMGRSSSTW